MRTLEEAARARKWRYVLFVLSERLFESSDEENLRLFREAVVALRQAPRGRHVRRALGILWRYALHLFRRNGAGRGRCAIEWLCLFPKSSLALRQLMQMTRNSSEFQPLFLTVALLLPLKKIRKNERMEFCRKLLLAGKGEEAAGLARRILELQPASAEARHLLWSALLQKTEGGAKPIGMDEKMPEKLFTEICEQNDSKEGLPLGTAP
ncbi:MAG: hypothetical protein LBF24_02475 [Puniceicoccales bacterium]|nr:hypothetical protein [Puniceicoccales bacterium]